jgi:hypothetical protein
MNNKHYLIQFKVECASEMGNEEGDDGGGDNEDPGNGDDTRMEDFQHDLAPDSRKPIENRRHTMPSSSQGQGEMTRTNNRPSSSKKVATSASLFQNKDE